MRIYPVYELCSRSQAAATNQHTNAQRRGEFCFIESGLFDLYSDNYTNFAHSHTKSSFKRTNDQKRGAGADNQRRRV